MLPFYMEVPETKDFETLRRWGLIENPLAAIEDYSKKKEELRWETAIISRFIMSINSDGRIGNLNIQMKDVMNITNQHSHDQ